MKNLKDILQESILDDIDTQIKKGDKVFKDEINAFLKENFKGASSCKISRNPNSDGKYKVSSSKDIEVKNNNITSLTNGMFIWTTVDGSFAVRYCEFLNSLEDAPKEVGGTFNCSGCDSLESLKGAPKKVNGDFYCGFNNSLTSLKGAPKEVGGSFKCFNCYSLESLKGAPEKVGDEFNCNGCYFLESLKGAPKEVGGDFRCFNCKVKFTKDDVKKVSNVKGNINC